MPKLKIADSGRLQTTIARNVILDGLSANDFRDCAAELLPAPAGQGIVFDTPRGIVPADIGSLNRDETRHTTSLRVGLACVRTVEHLLSAVHGMGIDNLTVRLNRCGIPFRDFSAEWFSQKLRQAELIELGAPRLLARIGEEFSFEDKPERRRIIFRPTQDRSDGLSIGVRIDFPDPIGRLHAEYSSENTDYRKDIAWARSFVASPLDSGGDKWERIRQIYPILPEDPTESPLITYDCRDYLTPLRRPDEPAKHKLLDFLGDISLLGYRLAGRIEVSRPGHRFTAETVSRLKEMIGTPIKIP